MMKRRLGTLLLLVTLVSCPAFAANTLDAPKVIYFDGHTHTTHSDGSGSLADIKTVARARGLDAVIVTNHTEQIDHQPLYKDGMNEWQEIVSLCAELSDDDFMMLPAFEVSGREGTFLRDHVLAWGVSDPYVGDDALGLAPEEVWPSPRNMAGTGPLFPGHITQWVDYIQANGGIAVHAHTSGSTQPSYGMNMIELWNTGHVKSVAGGAAALGFPAMEAFGLGVLFNNMAIDGDKHLFDVYEFPGMGTVPLRLALYYATLQMVDEYGNSGVGQWLGIDPTGSTPNGTPLYSWDELLMMYVNGELDAPIFGVANSDAHNTIHTDPADTNYSDVGEAKNGVLIRGEVNPASLLHSIKGGHLFATTGPTVDVTIDGRIMGETVKIEGLCNDVHSVAIDVSAKAEAAGRIITSVKVIKNGEVLMQAAPNAPAYQQDIEDTVTENSYYRVEVTTIDMALYAGGTYPYFYAWSNPIFVERLAEYPDGDTNKDCKVDMIDLAAVADNWLVNVN
jgi:hypothetical protein